MEFLPTAVIADACVRLKLPLRMAPEMIRPIRPGIAVCGRARPARHVGSVDVFLEAIEAAERGDVLVIDDGGRDDQGCIGDLTVIEAKRAGLVGAVVWGRHRDTAELRRIGWPVWSRGARPAGPVRVDARPGDALARAAFGAESITSGDVVFADDDGVIFLAAAHLPVVEPVAWKIFETERSQAKKVARGVSLRAQLGFSEYLHRRTRDPEFTFRQHLRERGGAIEE